MADNPLNAVNRGVYISDNLPFLKSLNDGCIDLVCIDPLFAKNETFGRKNDKSSDPLKPELSDAERAAERALLRRWGIRDPRDAERKGIDWPATAYKDFWSWEGDVHEEWVEDIKNDHPAVHALIEGTRLVHSDGTAAYLCYMAVRLFEIHRVLKDTGSLYLHCDHTAGSYLRQLLDGLFGSGNFRREIVWDIAVLSGYKTAANNWIRGHDTILYYSKSEQRFFDRQTQPHRPEYIKRFNKVDENGERYFDGRGKRRYLKEVQQKGKAIGDVWADIMSFQQAPTSVERIGYPTQKPVALAERIIAASCPPDGVVLDCFAGCAYVPVAAERLGRRWVACDINARAWTVFKRQFAKPKLVQLECAEPMEGVDYQRAFNAGVVTVHGPDGLPIRTTAETTKPVPTLTLKPRIYKVKASIIPENEMLTALLKLSHYEAWCCGFANRMQDGQVMRVGRNFHLDHLDPVSRAGTSHQITNRAPLCPYHNIMKSNEWLHLAEYREKIADEGELMVPSLDYLIDLDYARAEAERLHGVAFARQNPQMPLPTF